MLHKLLAFRLTVSLAILTLAQFAMPIGQGRYVETTRREGGFTIARDGNVASIYVDPSDHIGVVRAVKDLQADVQRVTRHRPVTVGSPENGAILVGTIGKSRIIDELIRNRKLDVRGVKGKWEASLTQVVKDPMPGVASALVIAGSDKRGTIYGVYDLSEQMGVSPWYWWADVPVRHRDTLYVAPGRHVRAEPAVKYRGIFINDEGPSLSNWVYEKFGNYNHHFYEHVFELLLRLRANYLWPAMWNNCFSEDDPLNPKTADEYGIVMGTSHVEPMMRADKEWNRKGYTADQWNYDKSPGELRQFWTEGIERNKPYENIVTIAMRGKIDTPMSETANIALLERIVADQRKILAEHINPDLSKVPQLWALYKEVQEYYEKGMRVPDDVTLLWCDDNWGNIRRLPTEAERSRSGGAGIYYHFDYVGGPRNYKWINTNPLPKIWEQMNLAYRHGADRIWIVNVGDIKPMEIPTEFFLTLAWDPDRWPKERVGEYTRLWAAREFGEKHAAEIADLVSKYAKYNGRRKPELLDPSTYSLTDYREADRVLAEWNDLVVRSEAIYQDLPESDRDAFFQLVQHPVNASAVLNELYISVGKNRLYAQQGRVTANDMAARAESLFQADAEWTRAYHRLGGGRWNHIMDQTHIGYTSWQEPPRNAMPAVERVQPKDGAEMGVAIEGSHDAVATEATLPPFDSLNRPRRLIEVFNRGGAPFEFTATPSAPWIRLTSWRGRVDKEVRISVDIDWAKAPKGSATGSIAIIQDKGRTVTVHLNAFNPESPTRETLRGFSESDGYVSIEPEHYTKKIDGRGARWERIDGYGRNLLGMSVFPVTAPSVTPGPGTPCLEYRMYLFAGGKAEVEASLSPTLDFVPGHRLRIAFSFDDEAAKIVEVPAAYLSREWEASVRDNARRVVSSHLLAKPGYHTLKVWMVDPAVVLQKIVVNLGGERPSYLGPPESYRGLPR